MTTDSASASASQWTSPASRPAHIDELISGVDRYNPQNLAVLVEYLQQQLDSGEYDCLANLAILKLFQFNAGDFDYGVAISVLLKALTSAPYPDFSLCLALLGEAPVAVLPAPAEAEDGADPTPADASASASAASSQPSAGHLADPLIVRLATLSALLHAARFRAFWTTLASPEFEDVREATAGVAHFEDAVRAVVLQSVKGAFRAISEKRIGSYLNLSGKDLAAYIEQQQGWTLKDGMVHVPANPDNEVKATVIREDLQLDQLTKFLAQAQTA